MNKLKIGLLVHPKSPITSIFGPREMFMMAASVSPAIELELSFIAPEKGTLSLASGASIDINSSFSEVRSFDLILIAALGHPSQTDLSKYAPSAEWLSRQVSEHTQIASICSGAFLLAEAALVNQKQVTTHWITADLFRSRYPSALLDIDQMVCRDGNIWSSGGAYAFQDLCLSLIQFYWGQTVAEYCANVLMLEPPRRTQNRFASLHGYKLHKDDKVRTVQTFIEANFSSELGNSELAKQAHLSERQMIRRFKHATGTSPNHYLQHVRMEAAKKHLRDGDVPINLIADEVGYTDLGYFRTLFKKVSGQTPTEYRRMFGVKN